MDLIETGKIINTHGVRGEVKVEPWSNAPEDLLDHSRFFIEGREYKAAGSRVHKGFVLVKLEGVDTLEAAEALREKTVSVPRGDIALEDGEYLLSDLVGLSAVDADTGGKLGEITEILTPPGGAVMVITGQREILVPVRPEFITGTDFDAGAVCVRLIEGM